jgi:hypothetical protein
LSFEDTELLTDDDGSSGTLGSSQNSGSSSHNSESDTFQTHGSGNGGVAGFGGGGAAGGGGGGGSALVSDNTGGYTDSSKAQLLLQQLAGDEVGFDLESLANDLGDEVAAVLGESTKEAIRSNNFVEGRNRYETLRSQVKNEISQLRVVLESAEAKEKEREWLQGSL